MRFFGRIYSTAAYEECKQADVPVGELCARCGEPIARGDDGWLLPHIEAAGKPPRELPYHAACHLRMIVGSVAHQQRRCLCFVPGSQCGDDPALTRRQAAEWAEAYFLSFAPKEPPI